MIVTIIVLILCTLLMFSAGMLRGIQDVLAFHFNKSYFDKAPFNKKYWYVNESSKNKYDATIQELPFTTNSKINHIIKFLSDFTQKFYKGNILCQLSDAWHFIKVFEYTCTSLSVALMCLITVPTFIYTWVFLTFIFFFFAIINVVGFNLTWEKLSPKK